MPPGLTSRLAPSGVALLLAFAAHAPALRPDRRLAGRDLYTVYEPLFLRVAAAWRGEGSLLRDPLRGAGMPLLADPLAQVAYPPGWLRALLPFQLGHALLFPLHAALCGLGAALLSRRLGAGPRGACLAAAAGALAGPVLSACRTPNLLAGTAWLGFALAGLLALPEGGARARRGLALAAAAIALTLLGGGIELVLLLGLGVAVAGPGLPAPARAGWLVGAALAAALGAALSAVHLWPCLRWIPESARGAAGPIPAAQAAVWAEHPLRLLEAVVPGLSPGAAPGLYARDGALSAVGRSFGRFAHPLHASLHLGLPVLALAVLCAWRRARVRGPVLALCLAAGAWLLVGLRLGALPGFRSESPLFEVLHTLPLFDGWQYPGKALLPLCVVVAALAGAGLRHAPRRWRLPAFAATAALGLLAQRLDPQVLPTLPAARVEEPPPLARELLGRDPGGRYLRLTLPRPEGAGFEAVRAAHREVLLEDLATRFGVPALRAYPPFYNRRLEPYLAARGATIADLERGTCDLAALASEACVAHLLTPAGLRELTAAPRVRLLSGEGRIAVERYEPTRIEVELFLTTPAVVFVSEGFEPGWSARLIPAVTPPGSGEPLAIEEAALLFMRVGVPAGEHRLVLRYWPPGLWPGALLSALAGLALVLLIRSSRG